MKPLIHVIALLAAVSSFAEDGKVFLKSEPPGAAVFLKEGDKLLGKTAGIIAVPQGKQTLLLKLAGYKTAELEVDVQGTAIIKPDAVVLEKQTFEIDIIFDEEDWRVFINKKPVNSTDGKVAMTPCTVTLTGGAYELGLAKEGFADISQKVEIKEKGAIEVKTKPSKGVSALLKAANAPEKPAKASDQPAYIKPGLTLLEYPRHKSQDKEGEPVALADMGQPVGPAKPLLSLKQWKFTEDRNAVASGFLKITVPGEYSFNSNNFYDRNALIVNGEMICPFRDGEKTVARITLPIGWIPIVSIGYVGGRGSVHVQWQPPGKTELSDIPADVLFSDARK